MYFTIHSLLQNFCNISDECTTYTEIQCLAKCKNTNRRLEDFNSDSACPCVCKCPDFGQSSCKKECQEEGKVVVLGSQNQFGCLQCKCICPPYHDNTCQNQCDQEGKFHIVGAKNRFGCDICQCGCLNRDCHTECGDLEFRVKIGSQGCIVGCQCICPHDCAPNCHGCIKKGT